MLGSELSLEIDLARATSTDPASEAAEPRSEILGGSVECEEVDVLWTSPRLRGLRPTGRLRDVGQRDHELAWTNIRPSC